MSSLCNADSRLVLMLVLTKAEQLGGDVWQLLKTVEEAVRDQGAFLPSLLCPVWSSPSLDEDGRDWEGGAGGVDAQRNLPRLGMKTSARGGLTDLA